VDSIYLDNNSTTPMLPAVWEAMRPFVTEIFGNPASAHRHGSRARLALEDARELTASLLGAFADEVIFTSGATEANNLAIFGLVGNRPAHIISTPIEHPSVNEPVARLQEQGWTIDRLSVDRSGVLLADGLTPLIRADTCLVSAMLANHETGAIQPIADLASRLDGQAAFHCDAVQAVGKIPVSFHDLHVTTLSVSAHKFHGPKGVGAFLIRRKTPLKAQVVGGHQQQGHRAGTEAVALAVGLATALDLAYREMRSRTERVTRLRRQLLDQLRKLASPLFVNGPSNEDFSMGHSLPHTLNISFPGCRADSLLMNLDLAGVACSTGSACSSGSLLPSPVLKAMELPEDRLGSSIRFSLSSLLSEEAISEAAIRISQIVNRLRPSTPS
jgi:cysteine desulfurase